MDIKRIFLIAVFALAAQSAYQSALAENGTYVQPHVRSNPDGYQGNNYGRGGYGYLPPSYQGYGNSYQGSIIYQPSHMPIHSHVALIKLIQRGRAGPLLLLHKFVCSRGKSREPWQTWAIDREA